MTDKINGLVTVTMILILSDTFILRTGTTLSKSDKNKKKQPKVIYFFFLSRHIML